MLFKQKIISDENWKRKLFRTSLIFSFLLNYSETFSNSNQMSSQAPMRKVIMIGTGMTIELIIVVRKVVFLFCSFMKIRIFFKPYGKVNKDKVTNLGNVPKTTDKMIAM